MSRIIDIGVKNRTYYFLDDMINIKNVYPNRIKMDKKSYKNIIIYYIGYITFKNPSSVKINSVNPLYVFIDKADGYIEESNGNKRYFLLVKNKDTLKKYTEHS